MLTEDSFVKMVVKGGSDVRVVVSYKWVVLSEVNTFNWNWI